MNRRFCTLALVFAGSAVFSSAAQEPEERRWAREAGNVTIVRDDWGIAHIYGKTDADAVFGMVYAQAEDDFNRVETNYLNSMGRLAEAEGESQNLSGSADEAVHRSRRAADSNTRPARRGCKTLMDAFADGLNFYLAKHPEVKPRVIRQFEPWMALSFTEGSIGGDIERVNLEPAGSVLRQDVPPRSRRPRTVTPTDRSLPARTASPSRPPTPPTTTRCY